MPSFLVVPVLARTTLVSRRWRFGGPSTTRTKECMDVPNNVLTLYQSEQSYATYRLRKNWLFSRFSKLRLDSELALIELLRLFGSSPAALCRINEDLGAILWIASDGTSSRLRKFSFRATVSGERPMPKK